MTIRHLAALTAMVGFLAFIQIARAKDISGGSGDKGDSSGSSSSQVSGATSSSDKLKLDAAQIQADFQHIQKDCDSGNYERAQEDLNLLVEHRRQYYADKAHAAKSSGSSTAPDSPPPSASRAGK